MNDKIIDIVNISRKKPDEKGNQEIIGIWITEDKTASYQVPGLAGSIEFHDDKPLSEIWETMLKKSECFSIPDPDLKKTMMKSHFIMDEEGEARIDRYVAEKERCCQYFSEITKEIRKQKIDRQLELVG